MNKENNFIKGFEIAGYDALFVGNITDCTKENDYSCGACPHDDCSYKGRLIVKKDGEEAFDNFIEINGFSHFIQQRHACSVATILDELSKTGCVDLEGARNAEKSMPLM
jgi:hypothetical protein